MPSLRFNQLSRRIKFLEKNLLPEAKIDGNYSQKEQDLIRSYILLVHAEIESFFELTVSDKAAKVLDDWIKTGKKSSCLKSILAFSGNDISYENVPQVDSQSIKFRVNRAVRHYLALIKKNNGVKQSDLIKILIPIGLEFKDLDSAWLSTMESFGSIRGNIAHNSIGVLNQIDRNTEVDRVNTQILPEIEKLDRLIKKIV